MGVGEGDRLSFEQVFDISYERVISENVDGRDFFEAFYERFLSTSVEISRLFKDTDMGRQRTMLKKSFYSLLTFYASSNADQHIEQIAHSHSRSKLNIRPELYDLWLEALIETAREFDFEFSPRTELAWRLVMAPGIVYMKFHYDQILD